MYFTFFGLKHQETAKFGTAKDHGKSPKVGWLLLLAVSSIHEILNLFEQKIVTRMAGML